MKAEAEAIVYSPIRYSLATVVKIDHELNRDLRIRYRWYEGTEILETIRPFIEGPSYEKENLKQGAKVHTLYLEPP